MPYGKDLKLKFSELEKKIAAEFWHNPNQSMKVLGKSNGVGKDKASYVIGKFLRLSKDDKAEILNEVNNTKQH